MTSITLAGSALLAQDALVKGIIQEILTTDTFFNYVPIQPMVGNSLAYNLEDVEGDAEYIGVGDTITARAPATFKQRTTQLTTVIAESEVNNLIAATRSSHGNDQVAVQIASKAKTLGRKVQASIINGTGTGNEFTGLKTLTTDPDFVDQEGGKVAGASPAAGRPLSFGIMDEMMDIVKSNGMQMDFFLANSKLVRVYYELLRTSQNGSNISETISLTMHTGQEVKIPSYRGVAIHRNDEIAIDETLGSDTDCTTLYAGNFDDGTMSNGLTLLAPEANLGITVENMGQHRERDETVHRLKWYIGMVLFTKHGFSFAQGIKTS